MKKIMVEFLDGNIIEASEEQKAQYLEEGNFEKTDNQLNYEYWFEVRDKPKDISHVDNLRRGTKFTLEFLDGHAETFNNYSYFENRDDDLKISMNKKRDRLTYKDKVFERRPDNLWVETNIKVDKGTKFTLKFKDGHKEYYQNYTKYIKRNDDLKMNVTDKLYFKDKVFKKTAKNYWVEERDSRRPAGPAKFKLQYLDGTVLECENKSNFKPVTVEENAIYHGKCGLYYRGVWFIQDENDKQLYIEKEDNFNCYKDKFYLLDDEKVYEFENMEYYLHRDDVEKIFILNLPILDWFEYKPAHTNKNPVLVRRYMIYKKKVYYNIDNLKTWLSLKNINKDNTRRFTENESKEVKEKLNHTNRNTITTFKKNGVYIFTPEKFQRNYKLYKENGGLVKFKTGKMCYYNNEVYEMIGNEWHYLRKAIDIEKANGKLIQLKQKDEGILAEIKFLRRQGFKIYEKWARCDFRQPNTITDEERKKKVKNKSRAKRKKALHQKKKRKGHYKEKRGIISYD